MKYINANSVFPEHLLKEMQKYIQGELVYIPKPDGVRKSWGETSGIRIYLSQRNREIRRKYSEGYTLERLSETYCLSFDSVKKIVYTKSPN